MDELQRLRGKIDAVDEKLVQLLRKRFELVREIFVLKERLHLPLTNLQREQQILRKVPLLLRPIFKIIIRDGKKYAQRQD